MTQAQCFEVSFIETAGFGTANHEEA